MPGPLLTGQIANAIYQGFKGKLMTGALVKKVPSGGLNALGDPGSTVETEYPCEGFVDQYSAHYKATMGIPVTDVKVCIFAKSLASGIEPSKDDRVTMTDSFGGTQEYKLRANIAIDPAGALWECQAFIAAA